MSGILSLRKSPIQGNHCDGCASQEGRHYCLLHSQPVENMDLMVCDDFTQREMMESPADTFWRNKATKLEADNAKLAGELSAARAEIEKLVWNLACISVICCAESLNLYVVGGAWECPALSDAAGVVRKLIDARAEIARLAKDRDEKQALNEYFRDTVGECHMMISRNTSEYQIRKEWDPTDLPPRLQGVMKRAENAEAEIARPKAAEIRECERCKEFRKASLHLDALTKADRGEGK